MVPMFGSTDMGARLVSPRASSCGSFGECGRALHDAHLSDGQVVAKMGHPALGQVLYLRCE